MGNLEAIHPKFASERVCLDKETEICCYENLIFSLDEFSNKIMGSEKVKEQPRGRGKRNGKLVLLLIV
jgi:hypothetical protein